MANINKATPTYILEGFDDKSQQAAAIEPIQLPQHLPHTFLLAERGRVAFPQICGGNGALALFGTPTFDLTSKFATHGTLISNIITARGNQQMFQRLQTPNGTTAMIRLSVEMIPCEIQMYKRNSDGTFAVDANGNLIPITITQGNTVTNVQTTGHRLVWHSDLVPYTGDAKQFGQGNIIADYRFGNLQMGGQQFSTVQTSVQNFNPVGDVTTNVALTGASPHTLTLDGGATYTFEDGDYIQLAGQTTPSQNGFYLISISAGAYTLTKWTGTNPVSSTVYPVLDLLVDSYGDFGNRVGLQLEAPNLDSVSPGNTALMDTIGAYLYRFTCVERPTTSTTPAITKTFAGSPNISACFKDNTVDTNNNPLSFTDTFISAYQNNDDPTVPPTWGPFGSAFLYRENLAAILDILINGARGEGDTLNSPVVVAQNVPLSDIVGNALWNVQDGEIVQLTAQSDSSLNGYYTVDLSYDTAVPPNQVYNLTPWAPDKTDQVNTVGEAAFDEEAAQYGRTANIAFFNQPANAHLLNIFTGVDQNGVPYYSFDVRNSVVFGGVAFGAGRTIYATGGSDGLPLDVNGKPDMVATMAIYDQLVQAQVAGYGDLPGLLLRNIPKYPVSTIWDSGFTMSTKKAMMNVMGVRPDMWLGLASQVLGDYTGIPLSVSYTTATVDGQQVFTLNDNVTQVTIGLSVTIAPRSITASSGLLPFIPGGQYMVTDINGGNAILTPFVLQPANTADQDNANGLVLSEAVAQHPDSALYGTAACRAIIVARCGKLRNSTWKGIAPLVVDIADKVAAYMGAGNGKWKSSAAMDKDPNNIVTLFKDINVTWRDGANKDSDWTNNLIYVEDFDTARQWYPAYQTVYNDDTSVLNSFLTMVAAAYTWKILIKSWQALPSGTTQLSPGQLIQNNNNYLLNALKGIFDNRLKAEVSTYQDPDDTARGYSYKARVKLEADPMITVGDFTVELDRNDGLPTTSTGVIA